MIIMIYFYEDFIKMYDKNNDALSKLKIMNSINKINLNIKNKLKN